MLCFLCACSTCFVPSCLAFFSLFSSVHPLFICLCMCPCVLVHVIKLSSYLSLYTRSRVPFRNFAWWHICCLYSNMMETSIWWNYGHQIQTYIFFLGHLFLLENMSVWQHACLIICLFAPLWAIFCLLVFFLLACLLVLCFFCCCMYTLGVRA